MALDIISIARQPFIGEWRNGGEEEEPGRQLKERTAVLLDVRAEGTEAGEMEEVLRGSRGWRDAQRQIGELGGRRVVQREGALEKRSAGWLLMRREVVEQEEPGEARCITPLCRLFLFFAVAVLVCLAAFVVLLLL